jgi:hypothetical protein
MLIESEGGLPLHFAEPFCMQRPAGRAQVTMATTVENEPRIPMPPRRRVARSIRMARGLSLAILGLGTSLHAQLAITEVLSNASTNLGTNVVVEKSDFWELTNFGTNVIALQGYSFNDRDTNAATRVSECFTNCFIGPGESIIFMRRDGITTRQEFIDWWGPQNLRPNLQVRTYPKKPGFDPALDAVQLFDPSGQLVDRVDFGLSIQGHTFGCHAETGEFGTFSTLGVNGAFKAVQADDVGSPGVSGPAIALNFIQQPEGVTQDAGLDVEFVSRAAGLPRPKYQWQFNGVALTGQKAASLNLVNVQPPIAGPYTVLISNGVSSVVSMPAVLNVNTTPLAARIVAPPSDITVYAGQTAVFTVRARGYPTPAYQWQRDGINIPGATSSRLEVPNVSAGLNGSIYSVVVQNSEGAATAGAQLSVTPRPFLAITEVMASAVDGNDWFELTNLDNFSVNLLGYRVSDTYAFDSAFRVTNSVTIEPGESVVFVERLSAAEFSQWWGAERLPANLKVITYYGLGLSRSGDLVLVWNPAEREVYEPVAGAAFLESSNGFSLEFSGPDYYFPDVSRVGSNGAFHCPGSADVGSPGYRTNPPPRFLSIGSSQAGWTARCRVVEGKWYDLRFKARFEDSGWVTVQGFPANDTVVTIPISFDSGAAHRFFRLEEGP